MTAPKRYSGRHVLVEFHGAKRLGDQRRIARALRAAAVAAGARVLGVRAHHFGEGYGVAAVALLAESHISIHTWPEYDYAAIDIFMCGAGNDPALALQVLKDSLGPQRVKVRSLRRGYSVGER